MKSLMCSLIKISIFGAVKKLAAILAFIFLGFLATPTIISVIDSSIDISLVFNINEEESSSKNQINMEYRLEETASNYESIHFLQEQKNPGHFYTEAYPIIFLDVISPPPKQA